MKIYSKIIFYALFLSIALFYEVLLGAHYSFIKAVNAEETIEDYMQYIEQNDLSANRGLNLFSRNISEFLEPRLSFKDFEGGDTTLKARRGKFIVLYTFATWCMSCSDELKSLDKMATELTFIDVKDIEIMPMSVDFKDPTKVFGLYKSLGIKNLPVYFDHNKRVMTALSIKSMPTTFLIDHTGYVITKLERNVAWSKKEVISELLDVVSQSRDDAKSEMRKKTYDLREEGDIMFQKDPAHNVTIIN